MNYVTISRGDENSIKVEERIIKEFNNLGFKNVDGKEEKIDYVISIGGDGTFLRSVQKFYEKDPIFVTINTGNFGYLCEYKFDEVENLIADVKSKVRLTKDVPLLECNLIKDGKVTSKMYGVNEFRIHNSFGNTLKFDVTIDDTFFETLKGDGCLISSSLGSSGVAKSLDGALIDNEIELLEFIEIAPISNNGYMSLNAPFVLSKEKVFTFTNFSSSLFNIYYDSEHIHIEDFKPDDIVKIFLSDKKVRVLSNKEKNYIKRTSQMFIR